MHRLVTMSRWLSAMVFEHHALSVKGRICAELLRLAESKNDLHIKVIDRDMATRVGTSRENVSRVHSELKRAGMIERRQGSMQILDSQRLREQIRSSEAE